MAMALIPVLNKGHGSGACAEFTGSGTSTLRPAGRRIILIRQMCMLPLSTRARPASKCMDFMVSEFCPLMLSSTYCHNRKVVLLSSVGFSPGSAYASGLRT